LFGGQWPVKTFRSGTSSHTHSPSQDNTGFAFYSPQSNATAVDSLLCGLTDARPMPSFMISLKLTVWASCDGEPSRIVATGLLRNGLTLELSGDALPKKFINELRNQFEQYSEWRDNSIIEGYCTTIVGDTRYETHFMKGVTELMAS
jgi:hypothetical protein